MSNPVLTNDVKNAIDALVAQGKSFTAFDVTKEVQRITGENYIPHRYVRPEVAALMTSGTYTDYDVRIRNDIAGSPREWFKVVPVATTVAATNSNSVSVGASTNEDGTRLRVFRDALSSIGLRAGNEARVLYSPILNKVFVVPSTSTMLCNDKGAKTANYNVDSRQNLRVQLATLGINTGVAITDVTKINSEALQISLQ